MNRLRPKGRCLGLLVALAVGLLSRVSLARETIGSLWERGLILHEAWTEARLSMDAVSLEKRWKELLGNLRRSLKKDVQMDVTSEGREWLVEFRLPYSPAAAAFVGPAGAWVARPGAPTGGTTTDILSFYPGRRHFDCDGRPLNPNAIGRPIEGRKGKMCAADKAVTRTKVQDLASDSGAHLLATKGLAGCYDVLKDNSYVLWPTQVLVELPGEPYVMQKDEKGGLWLRYLDNRRLFIMDRKQPTILQIQPSSPGPSGPR
jgi:hypothetical protein